MLKYKTITYFEITDRELDRFITEEYGQQFEFVPDQECGNDSEHSYSVEKEELDKYELEEIEKFKSGKYCTFICATLLKDLVNRDRISEGRYLVTVCW